MEQAAECGLAVGKWRNRFLGVPICVQVDSVCFSSSKSMHVGGLVTWPQPCRSVPSRGFRVGEPLLSLQ